MIQLYQIFNSYFQRFASNFDHLKWYDKVLSFFIFTIVLISLYVYCCTCSIKNLDIIANLQFFYAIIQFIDYFVIVIIVFGLIFPNIRMQQFQQLFGLILIVSSIIVFTLQFSPCMLNTTYIGEIKYSLLCPKYSLISWINLIWFGLVGLFNVFFSILIKKK